MGITVLSRHPVIRPAPRRRRWLLLLLAFTGLALLPVCAVGAWAVRLIRLNDATLVGISPPSLDDYKCLVGGHFIRPGPSVTLNTEWVIDDDLVPVLAAFGRQGWYMTSHSTTPVQMLPSEPTALDMGLLRVQVFRSVALSYAQAGGTRVIATTSAVACPP